MSKNKDLLSKSLTKPAIELLADIAEMGLDEIIEKLDKDSDIIKQLPLIKWLFIGNNIRSNIQSASFIRKYSNFIGKVASSVPMRDIDNNTPITFTDENIRAQIVENTIIYLDRYHNELKAKLLGELFVQTFIMNKFSINEYNSLMFSIEQIHPFDGMESLRKFYDYKVTMDAESDNEKKREIWAEGSKIQFHQLLSSGLITPPLGASTHGDLGGAFLNDIGKKFYQLVISKCINNPTNHKENA